MTGAARLFLIMLLFRLLSVSVTGYAEEGQKEAGSEEELPVEVDVERISARIDPEIELTIPSGRFHLLFEEDFQKLHARFSLNYEFLDNAIDGSIRFTRPIGVLEAGVRFYDGVDFENFLKPVLRNGDVFLEPGNEYVQRDRGMELDARLPLYTPKDEKARATGRGLFVKGALKLNETFRGDFDRTEVIDEGLDLIFLGNLFYKSVRQKQSPLGSIPVGTFTSTLFQMRYRKNFKEPVALDHRYQFVHYNDFFKKLSFTANVGLSYPIAVWRDDIATFYTLGGYDTVRGFQKHSIGAFRYLLLSTDVEYLIKSMQADIPEFLTLDLRLTQVRLMFLVDGLFSQDSLKVDSPVYGHVSVGGGVSLVFVEGKKRHYTVRIYAAQALERDKLPMFYFSITSSRFKLQESVKL
jgi:hypothetical protein